MNMMGEGFQDPNVAPALKVQSSNCNRSVRIAYAFNKLKKTQMYLHHPGGTVRNWNPRFLAPTVFLPSLYRSHVGIPSGLSCTECAFSYSSPRTQHLQDGAAPKQISLWAVVQRPG